MKENINTRTYWEHRFSSGDWEEKQGRSQTVSFAKRQVPYLQLGADFEGTLLDFGCGLGDAMSIYKSKFPKAKLVGIDISQSAIDSCRDKYGSIASFMQGDYESVPDVDIIICSNVLEHLTDDRKVMKYLLQKCKSLYVCVPYKEAPLQPEHINTYDEDYFSDLGKYDYKVFPLVGLIDQWYQIYFKNIFRFLLGRPLRRVDRQIIFHLINYTK